MASIPKLHKAARWYSAHDIPVFPLHGKRPATGHGHKDATTQPQQIDEWWARRPHANIGIPIGALTKLLLLDLDFYAKGSVVQNREDVIRLYGPIPDTAEVISGRARHIYFGYGGGPVPKQLAPGVQLKGSGGYAVAPPSIHPITGCEYVFDGIAGPSALLNVADAPDWLLMAIADASKPRPMAEPQAGAGVHIADDDLITRARKASRKFLRLWDGSLGGRIFFTI
jgi:hypothetical protein